MRKFLLILLLLIMGAVAVGFYYKEGLEANATGDKIIGIAVLVGTFIFMPLFLYHRWKGKRLQDYTLTPENIKRMRDGGSD